MSEKLDEDLRSAIKKDDVDALSTLIKGDVDVNKTIIMKLHTLLTYASYIGSAASIKVLIAMGADVNLKDKCGKSALLQAAMHKKNGIACMEILISAGANINVDASEPNKSPLFVCATQELQKSFQFLIDKGASVNLETANGDSILHHILEYSNLSDSLVISVIKKIHKDFLYSKNSKHMTPLIIACQNGKVSCLRALLRRYKDLVNGYDDEGKTALIHAAIGGKTACLEALIQSGSNVNSVIEWQTNNPVEKSGRKRTWKGGQAGMTPLMFASENGHLNVVVKLIELGANVNQASVYGITALVCAVRMGHLKCIEALIKAGADVNKHSHSLSLTSLATLHNHYDCLEYLVKQGAEVTGAQFLLKILEHQDNAHLVELLLRKGADANDKTWDGKTPLMIAAERGHIKSLNILLHNKRVEIDCQQNKKISNYRSALMMAAIRGNVQCLNSLINAGANINFVNSNGSTALSMACRSGQFESVKALVAKEAEINPADRRMDKPLFSAFNSSSYKKTDLVYWLLDHGANVNDRNTHGDSFLHVLLGFSPVDSQLMEKCIELGADLASTNNAGKTLLMTAASSFPEEALVILLKRGVPINEGDGKGHTAVMYACRSGRAKCLKYLLNAGAHVNFKPEAQTVRTALSFAVIYRNIECVKILGEHFREKCKNSLSQTKACFSHLKNTVDMPLGSPKMIATLAAYGFISMEYLNKLMLFPQLVRERFLTSDSIQIFHKDKEMAPLEAAFRKDDVACVNYLLLNNFICSTDISFMFSDFRQVSENDSYRTNSILQQLTKQPWSLQKLCLSQITSSVKPFVVGDERNQAVESLPIPNRFKSQLKFNNEFANLCPTSWGYLKYCFSKIKKMTLFVSSAHQKKLKNVSSCLRPCCRNHGEHCLRFTFSYHHDYDREYYSDTPCIFDDTDDSLHSDDYEFWQ